MKKIKVIFLVMLLVLSLVLVSCGSSYTSGGNSDSSGGDYCTHSLSNPKVVKEATCTESGILGGTCSKCGTYATNSFGPDGHNFNDGFCTICGEAE